MNLSDETPIARQRARGLLTSIVRTGDPRNFSGLPIPRLDFLTDAALLQRLRTAEPRIRELAVDAQACRESSDWWMLLDRSVFVIGPLRCEGTAVPELLSLQAWDTLHDFLFMLIPKHLRRRLIAELSPMRPERHR